MSDTSVLVIGEALIDIVAVDGVDTEVVGGSPANVALGLGRLGIPVRFLTGIADDDRGRRIAAHLEASTVEVDPASWALADTSTATVTLNADGSANYIFAIDASLAAPELQSARTVHIGSISAFMAPSADVIEAFLATLPADVTVTLDPNIRPALVGEHADAVARFERLAARATVVKLSDEDAEWLYPDASLDDVLERIGALGPVFVAITRGGEGALMRADGIRMVASAPKVTVADTVGAGDTFMAALLAQFTRDPRLLTHRDSARLTSVGSFAALAAAQTVQRRGADLPWAAEMAALS